MKLYLESVTVDTTDENRPHCIHWRGKTFEVCELEDYWIFCGKWWQSEERRYYLRVQTGQGSMEIFRRDDEWVLSRMLD